MALVVVVAVGMCAVLAIAAVMHAASRQRSRTAWLASATPVPASGSGGLLWRSDTAAVGSHRLYRVDIAVIGPGVPVIPGIPKLPGPNQFYASPAFDRLPGAVARSGLGADGGAALVGTIADSALAGPDALVVVAGEPVGDLSGSPGVSRISSINTDPSRESAGGVGGASGFTSSESSELVAFAVLLLFVSLVVSPRVRRLGRPFPLPVRLLTATAAALGAALLALIGFLLAHRFLTATTLVTDEPFFPGDVSAGPFPIFLLVVGVPAAAGAAVLFTAAELRLRRRHPWLAGDGDGDGQP
jgi:hypothetical protein